MKANLERKQWIALAAGATTILLATGLGWFGFSKLGQKQEEAQALADRMGNPALAALVADPGGATRARREVAEIQKLEKELLTEDQVTAGWSRATEMLGGANLDWAKDPGKWKDELIAIQSRLQKSAKDSKVKLASDFYLGLEAYRQKSPSPDEVPGLAMHLAVAERLVQLLFEARKVSEQYPTLCEIRGLTGPGSVQEKETLENLPAAPGPNAKPPAPSRPVDRKTFRMEIRSSPEVLYAYVRLLASNEALLILSDLTLANEKQNFPLRSEIAKKFSEPASAIPGEETSKSRETKKLLEILAGEEPVNASLMVDFVAWKNPGDEKTGTPSSPVR